MRRLTEAEREEIRRVYAETKSGRKTARRTGHTINTVQAVVGPQRIVLPADGSERVATKKAEGSCDLPKLLASLRRQPLPLEEIARRANMTVEAAQGWLTGLGSGGINVFEAGGLWGVDRAPALQASFDAPIMEVLSGPDDTFTLGALGDSHLCSKYFRPDVLNGLYDRFVEEGISTVFHTGNWIDGEARFNRHALLVHGMDAQLRYLADHYPKRYGIQTYAVAGDDHEGWYCQQSGVDIGRYAAAKMADAGRTDWHDLGYMEAYVKLVNRKSGKWAMLHVVHPGGGSAYATSYTIQKIVESYGGGEKPAVLFAGHYHKMELINIRNVWCCQTGTQQDQTPFMRKKRLEAHVGGLVVRLRQDPRTGAISEMTGTMLRYFNTGYYNHRWSESGPVNPARLTLGGV